MSLGEAVSRVPDGLHRGRRRDQLAIDRRRGGLGRRRGVYSRALDLDSSHAWPLYLRQTRNAGLLRHAHCWLLSANSGNRVLSEPPAAVAGA